MLALLSIILLQYHTTTVTAFQLFSRSKPNNNAETTTSTNSSAVSSTKKVDEIIPPASTESNNQALPKSTEPTWLPFYNLEPSSFVASTIDDQEGPVTFTFFISRRVNKPASCDVVEFQDASAPIAGIYNYTFSKISDNIYNNHFGYYNGQQFLSFVSVGDHGTWIVGNKPGVDDGIAYIRPKHYTLTPVGLENDVRWKWSVSNEWKEVNSVRLVCKDPFVDDFSHFYEVEGFRNVVAEEPDKFILRSTEDSFTGAITLVDPSAQESGTWLIKNMKLISTMGKPQMITDARGFTTPVVLVNHEGGGQDSWRLTYRRIRSQLHLPLKDRSTDTDDFEWDYKSELLVKLFGSTAKLSNGYTMQTLNRREQILDMDRKISEIQSVNVGDYVWAWLRPLRTSNMSTPNVYIPPSYHESDQLMLLCVYQSKRTWLFRYYPSDRRDQMGQSVLARDTELLKFTLHEIVGKFSIEDETCDADGLKKSPTGITPTAQQAQQKTSRNDYSESDKLLLSVSIESGSDFVFREYQLLNLMRIGADPIPLIKNYILEKERVLSDDISSCYLYHAGVSLPASFVYAAELVCVLMGAKPATMIQYQSDSDASWKFPALSELVNGVISARHLLQNKETVNTAGKSENKIDLQYQVWKYKNGEKVFDTLVIYRNASAYVAENILPRGTAQALHPMPFPDTSRLDEDYQEQIYNAAWNGLLLGYPPRFVSSYCKTFHNDLPEDLKDEIYHKAHKDLQEFLKSKYGKTMKNIQLGNDVPVCKEVWDVLSQVFLNRSVKL